MPYYETKEDFERRTRELAALGALDALAAWEREHPAPTMQEIADMVVATFRARFGDQLPFTAEDIARELIRRLGPPPSTKAPTK